MNSIQNASNDKNLSNDLNNFRKIQRNFVIDDAKYLRSQAASSVGKENKASKNNVKTLPTSNQSNANILIKMNKNQKNCPRCNDSPDGNDNDGNINAGRGVGGFGASNQHANKEYSWFSMILAMWTIMLFPLSLFGSFATALMTAAFADFVCSEFERIRGKVKLARIIIFFCNIIYYFYLITLLFSLFLAGEKVEPFTAITNYTCKGLNSIWIGNKSFCGGGGGGTWGPS